MGEEVDLQLGTSGLLSEDLNDPCRESELKAMYEKLRKGQWADFLWKLKKAPSDGTTRSEAREKAKVIRKQAEDIIEEVLQKSQEDILNIIRDLKTFLQFPKEHDSEIKTLQYYNLAVQNIQKAVFLKKSGFHNTLEKVLQKSQEDIPNILSDLKRVLQLSKEHDSHIKDFPDDLRALADECFKVSCLMALHNPPIVFDWDKCEEGPFPPTKMASVYTTGRNSPEPSGETDQTSIPAKKPKLLDTKHSTRENRMLTIAIQIGTAFSGYCFQFRGSDQSQLVKWGSEYSYDTVKTPTCILFGEDEQFLSFGYDAVMTYTQHIKRNEAQKYFFFENFKMELYDKELHRDLKIKDRTGKEMRAMKVFSESLRFMKDHALETIGEHMTRVKFSDATWVLTVPAIWNAAAKQFMREAATEAGLITESDPERLIIALEPEAAAVWCKQFPSREAEMIEDVPGTQYMVVDCGDGTIDITVHEVVKGGRLKELHKVSGNEMGGQTVDENFIQFLREIFSDKVFDQFEKNHPNELQRLMYEFSKCKRAATAVRIPCPVSLQEIAKKEKTMEDYFSEISDDAEWDCGSIILKEEKMRSLHGDCLTAIKSLIREILNKPNLRISYIFLVGGFALSPYVSKFVRQKFGSQYTVLRPLDAQVAVLKGAVQFGTMPNVVESRISLFSYGISICVGFDESKHRGKRTYVNKEGVKYCNACFDCLVKKDKSVRYDETREFTFSPLEQDQSGMRFRFYCTESKHAKFVDEDGMKDVGSISVPMPDTRKGFNRKVKLEIRFGSTEMKATATDVDSGETRSVKLDFMSK